MSASGGLSAARLSSIFSLIAWGFVAFGAGAAVFADYAPEWIVALVLAAPLLALLGLVLGLAAYVRMRRWGTTLGEYRMLLWGIALGELMTVWVVSSIAHALLNAPC